MTTNTIRINSLEKRMQALENVANLKRRKDLTVKAVSELKHTISKNPDLCYELIANMLGLAHCQRNVVRVNDIIKEGGA